MTGWQEKMAQDARDFRALADRMARVAITEHDELVRVTVSADGQLAKLELTEPRDPVPLAQIADRVMRCLARAKARIPDVLERTMTETVGTTDTAARVVLADARQKFPVPEPLPRLHDVVEEVRIGAVAPEPRRPERPQLVRQRQRRDDDWNERSYLEDV